MRLSSLFLLVACGHVALAQAPQWHNEDGYRWHELTISAEGKSGFTLMAPGHTGISFKNELDLHERSKNRVLDNGSGVAMGDYDGDGRVDLFFAHLHGRNALYRNGGDWKFWLEADQGAVSSGWDYCRGAVFADVNGDRAVDLLISTTGRGVHVLANDGTGKFRDFSKSAGTRSENPGLTMTLGDVDGNGTLDLYVANNRAEDIRDRGKASLMQKNGRLIVPSYLQHRFVIDETDGLLEYGEPDTLFLNDGQGHFQPVSWTGGVFMDEAGSALEGPPRDWGLTAAFRDLNGDGAPDLYVCNDYWTPDRIWINDGRGRFKALPNLAIRHTCSSSMGVDFADLGRTGAVDIFVVDMLSREHTRRLTQLPADKFEEDPAGRFERRHQIMRNTLLRNRGDGTFAEIADYAGLRAAEWAWQPIFLDVDLDGWEDVLISAGHIRNVQDRDANERIEKLKRKGALVPAGLFLQEAAPKTRQEHFTAELYYGMLQYPPLDAPIVAFRNRGNLQFEEMTAEWGLAAPGVHQGMALGDLDEDGDLDVAVNNLNAVAGIYRNETRAPRVAVRLRGAAGNTQGIGAKINLLGGAVPAQSLEVISGGRYLSGCDPMRVFAAGKSENGMTIEVTWRSGNVSMIKGVKPNRLYEIEEAGAKPGPARRAEPPPRLPLFADVTDRLNHTHVENDFDDFAREPLLPNRLSRLGPGVAWHDVNGDRHEDLVIGSGKGGRLAILLNNGKGGFDPIADEAVTGPLERDQCGLVAWSETRDGPPPGRNARDAPPPGRNARDGPPPGRNARDAPPSGRKTSAIVINLLAAAANFEDGKAEGESASALIFHDSKARPVEGLPGVSASTGPLALGTLDGHGLALFSGGRVLPGRYPAPPGSRLFRHQIGKFVIDETNSPRFANLGLVTSALFTDLSGDGFSDLVVTLEWGPVAAFLNDGKGNLREATDELGLSKKRGWWNGIASGDFDEDGRMDLVATNWGLNSKYEHHYDAEHPLEIYYGDFNGDGVSQILECHYDAQLGKVVPDRGRHTLAPLIPWIAQAMPTHAAFAASSIEEIFGERLRQAASVSANTLAHTVFLNRGTSFETLMLPSEAQWAPAFGVTVADFDGDGHEDIFIAQNFSAAQRETPRIDAGRGLLLRGDGRGGFLPMPAPASGLEVYGDGRGCAAADYDADGRTDLVVAQNGAATRLFHNEKAIPGVRVRLRGTSGNLDAIGAQVRLVFGKRHGPVRELQAGSGYWSQNSLVPVLGSSATPTAVWVRWPGGKVTTTKIPARAKEIIIEK
ncbi:MAG: FG-GAP-like repeat-containing protein [Verrucomicrobiales bacterium]